MTTAGIIGGITPGSTIEYYRLIIARYREQKADQSYPSIIINSIDLTRMLGLAALDDRAGLVAYLSDEMKRLADAGADFGLFASNTPHIVFDELAARSPIPLISIVESTRAAAQALRLKKAGLLGTRFTMQGRFYPDAFSASGIEVIAPQGADQTYVHDRYMSELVNGVFLNETRDELVRIIDRLREREHIEAVILGGTELPLILRHIPKQPIPFLDTTSIHVEAVVGRLLD